MNGNTKKERYISSYTEFEGIKRVKSKAFNERFNRDNMSLYKECESVFDLFNKEQYGLALTIAGSISEKLFKYMYSIKVDPRVYDNGTTLFEILTDKTFLSALDLDERTTENMAHLLRKKRNKAAHDEGQEDDDSELTWKDARNMLDNLAAIVARLCRAVDEIGDEEIIIRKRAELVSQPINNDALLLLPAVVNGEYVLQAKYAGQLSFEENGKRMKTALVIYRVVNERKSIQIIARASNSATIGLKRISVGDTYECRVYSVVQDMDVRDQSDFSSCKMLMNKMYGPVLEKDVGIDRISSSEPVLEDELSITYRPFQNRDKVNGNSRLSGSLWAFLSGKAMKQYSHSWEVSTDCKTFAPMDKAGSYILSLIGTRPGLYYQVIITKNDGSRIVSKPYGPISPDQVAGKEGTTPLRNSVGEEKATASEGSGVTPDSITVKEPSGDVGGEKKKPVSVLSPTEPDTNTTEKKVENATDTKKEKPKNGDYQNAHTAVSDAIFNASMISMDVPPMDELFKISVGLLHYFIRPDDDFVLNSLEIVDANTYLYRELRREQYKHILFIGLDGIDLKVYAYDQASAIAFMRQYKSGNEEFESLSVKTDHLGRYELATITGAKRFLSCFNECFKPMFDTKQHRFALVMPLAIQSIEGYFSDDFLKIIESMRHLRGRKGCIIFTLQTKTELVSCYYDKLLRLIHGSWAAAAYQKNSGRSCSADESVSICINALKAAVVTVKEEMEIDEVSNLLIRKAVIEEHTQLSKVMPSKLYALATAIVEQCVSPNSTQYFKSLRPKEIGAEHIRYLENEINDNSILVEEMIHYAESVAPVQIMYSDELHPLLLNRVFQTNVLRFQNTNTLSAVREEMQQYVGENIRSVIDSITKQIDLFKVRRDQLAKMKESGKKVSEDDLPVMNMIFYGSPGTGKTSIAKLTARYLNATGVLPTDRYVYITASQINDRYIGWTEGNLKDFANKAVGGVLFIDEFQGFDIPINGGNRGRSVAEALTDIINRHRYDLCIIVAGYKDKVEKVLRFDEGLPRRFNEPVFFQDYSDDDLLLIFESILEKWSLSLETGVLDLLRKVLSRERAISGQAFGNAGFIKDKMFSKLDKARFMRDPDSKLIKCVDVLSAFPDIEDHSASEEEILRKFDKLTGIEMADIKQQIINAVRLFREEKQAYERESIEDKDVEMPYINMVFSGPPGTGKTTIAKLTAKYLCACGVLPSDRYVELSARECVGGLVGDTDKALRAAAERASGGVLFIDEFQGFYQGHSMNDNVANQAMGTIVSIINKYRHNICIIVAGYEDGVNKVLACDEGAARRFPRKIKFRNYCTETLMSVLDNTLRRSHYEIDDDARNLLMRLIDYDRKQMGQSFGNAGYVKDTIYSYLKEARLSRGASDKRFILQDVEKAFTAKITQMSSSKVKYTRIPQRLFESLPYPYDCFTRDMEELQATTDSAILFIRTYTNEGTVLGYGTGFLVHPDGYAITCNHVIRGAERVEARLRILGMKGGSDRWYNCSVINTKDPLDMALIQLEGNDFPYLAIADEERDVVDGEEYLLSGYPFAMEQAITHYSGRVATSAQQKDVTEYEHRFIDGQAKSGDSGAPLISLRDSRVIGILIGADVRNKGAGFQEEMNFMRPIKYFWKEFTKPGEAVRPYQMVSTEEDTPNTIHPTAIPVVSSEKIEKESRNSTYRIATYEELIEAGYDALSIAERLVENDANLYPGIELPNAGTPEQWAKRLMIYPETFRYLVDRDNTIVGNWSFLGLSEDVDSEKLAKGELSEESFTIDNTEYLRFPGDYIGYLLNFSANKGYDSPKNIKLLFDALCDQLLAYAEDGIFFREWYVNVFREEHEVMYRRMGFAYSSDHVHFGKMYKLDCKPFPPKSLFLKNKKLKEIYDEHYQS